MLTAVLAHVGQPPAPHDVWDAWNPDPLLLSAGILAVWAYRRGMAGGNPRPVDRWRARSFAGALLALGLALLSPLEAVSGALASAHMVQHVLLVLVAAPLLAFSAPSSTLLRGSPGALRRGIGRLRRGTGLRHWFSAAWRSPVVTWLLHVVTVWVWHSRTAYDAALRSDALHVLEHGSFVLTGTLFWSTVIGVRGSARSSRGLAVLFVFGMAMQSVFLSALLTFARSPWYETYAATTSAWGLQPLQDQQLAGVLMWIPGGVIHVIVALALLSSWIRSSEEAADAWLSR